MNSHQGFWAIAFLLVGCQSGTTPMGGGGGSGGDGGGPDAIGVKSQSIIDGTVSGSDAKPMSGIAVHLCNATPICRDTTTATDGSFKFSSVEQGFYTLRAARPADAMGQYEYASIVVPVYSIDGVEAFHSKLILPRVGAGTDLTGGPQTLAFEGGLSLSLDGDALTLPQGAARHLAAARVPIALLPSFCIPSSMGRVLAIWAFVPQGATSTKPITFHLGEALGLLPDANLAVFQINQTTGHPDAAGGARVSHDGKSIDSLVDGNAFNNLSWLLVTEPGGGGP